MNKLLINQISDRRQRRFTELMAFKKVDYLQKADYEIAIESGYSAKSAHVQASRLLKKDNIAAAIAELCNRMWEREAMSAQEMVSLLAKRARFDPKKYVNDDGTFDIAKLKADDSVIVDEITMVRDTVRVKGAAIPAMTLMARMAGTLDGEESNVSEEEKAAKVVRLIRELNQTTEVPDGKGKVTDGKDKVAKATGKTDKKDN